MAAQFVAEHSGAPAMMMALLFGMVVSFLHESDPKIRAGVQFSAKTILKLGIVLLGARISADLVFALGWQAVLVVVVGLVLTMSFGVIVGRFLGQSARFAILTAGAVSICGASAALAISAVLPPAKDSEKQLSLTIMGVTALSTVAMILYPALLAQFGASDALSGRVIGATIHDVAQVVGAGFSISDTAGDVATLVKLVRVSLLAPTVLVIAIIVQRQQRNLAKNPHDADGKRPPLVPLFLIGFICLATINSFGYIPQNWKPFLEGASKAALLTAIGAVGIKTQLKDIIAVGPKPVMLMVLQTGFIAMIGTTGFLILLA